MVKKPLEQLDERKIVKKKRVAQLLEHSLTSEERGEEGENI